MMHASSHKRSLSCASCRLGASGSSSRSAFTLVELLVAIGIFLILASLVLGAFNAVTDDRGSAAASSFRAWVEGAKSRAADLGRPVGIRPVVTSDAATAFGHGTAEFEYVASVEPLEGNLAYFEHLVWEDTATGQIFHQWRVGQLVSTADGRRDLITNVRDAADIVRWNSLDGDDLDGDGNADELNLIQPGIRIEIPRDSGNWYIVAGDDGRTTDYNEFGPESVANNADTSQGNYLTLVGGPSGDQTTFSPSTTAFPYLSGVDAFTEAAGGIDEHFLADDPSGDSILQFQRRSTYRLNSRTATPPTVAANVFVSQPRLTYRLELGVDVLEGERLLELPRGMVMDFDACQMAGYPGNYNVPFDPTLNTLMFSPTGEILGDFQEQSSIGFFFCEVDELLGARQNPLHPANEATNTATPTTYSNWVNSVTTAAGVPPVRAEPAGRPQIVTLLPKSGFVQKSEVSFEDTDSDGFANNPYLYRFEGRLDQ